MLLITHISLAHELNEILDIPNFNYFMDGLKYPDKWKEFRKLKHTKNNTFDKVLSLLEQIKKEDINSKVFAFKLGELIHYVMDYFCKYHINENEYNKLFRHVWHEVVLAFDRHAYLFTSLYIQRFTATKELKIPKIDDLGEFIERNIEEFNEEILSKDYTNDTDIIYAFTASYMCIKTILSEKSVNV
jgi:hypothetical protein